MNATEWILVRTITALFFSVPSETLLEFTISQPTQLPVSK
jgi:hypothetical protein